MRFCRRLGSGVGLAGLWLTMAGCGGFTGSHTVTPLDFLLPGLGQASPLPNGSNQWSQTTVHLQPVATAQPTVRLTEAHPALAVEGTAATNPAAVSDQVD
jgi:hypothetical protein